MTSDEDLIAWSQSLVRERGDSIDISDPPPAPAAASRRREPLRAAGRARRDSHAGRSISAEEIFDEIRERVHPRAEVFDR